MDFLDLLVSMCVCVCVCVCVRERERERERESIGLPVFVSIFSQYPELHLRPETGGRSGKHGEGGKENEKMGQNTLMGTRSCRFFVGTSFAPKGCSIRYQNFRQC